MAHFIIAHFIIYFFIFGTYIYIYSRVVLCILHCPLSGPDLIYISALIIFSIIEYVMNKRTLTLNPCLVAAFSVHYTTTMVQQIKKMYYNFASVFAIGYN